MADRARDLWDVLLRLQNLATPDIEAEGETLDAFQSPSQENVGLTDGVTVSTHSGTYLWNDPTTIWGRFQWG